LIIKAILCTALFTIAIQANPQITDVKTSDPSYSAVETAVDKGYFTLVDGTKFLPNQTVSRKELAIIIDRIDSLTKKTDLTADEIIELKGFSSQFKSYLESQENQREFVDTEVGQVKAEQKSINYDLSRVEDHIQQVEKTRKEQEIYIWLGLGLGILGVLK
jgi:septal ring factor EnvC (AmiA/AmiB activator)